MGMFDSYKPNCPHCGEERAFDFQSKVHDCALHEWTTIEEVPDIVLLDLVKEGEEDECFNCGRKYKVVGRFVAWLQEV